MSKLEDYDKVKKIIQSCTNSRQVLVAYEVTGRFGKVHGEGIFYYSLYDLCDSQMVSIA